MLKSDKIALIGFLKSVRGRKIVVGGNRWIGRKTAGRIEEIVKELLKSRSIVTGGAEGADHAAMRACLKMPERISVYLPGDIGLQYKHYRRLEGARMAGRLRDTLRRIKRSSPDSIIEGRKAEGGYRMAAERRNSSIVQAASGFIVFEPKGSRGSADALRKISRSGKPCIVFQADAPPQRISPMF